MILMNRADGMHSGCIKMGGRWRYVECVYCARASLVAEGHAVSKQVLRTDACWTAWRLKSHPYQHGVSCRDCKRWKEEL